MQSDSHITIIALILILVLALVIIIQILYPVGLSQSRASTITVTATGSAKASPSEGTINLMVFGSGNTSAIATANLSLAVARLNATITPFINNNRSLLETQDYSLYRVRNSTSFNASEQILVTIPDVANMSPALSSIPNIRNIYISSATAGLPAQQIAALRSSALSQALGNATSQAQTVSGDGVSLKLQNVTINAYSIFPRYLYGGASVSQGSGAIFFTGEETVTESITATYSYGK